MSLHATDRPGAAVPPTLRCPACREALRYTGTDRPEWHCGACDGRYPVLHGIADLRVAPDPYIGIEADRAKGLKLAERFDDFDFAGLVGWYYAQTEVVPPHHARRYTRGLLAAEARAAATLAAWEARDGGAPGPARGALLEIGCGTAPLLVAAAGRFDRLVGVDVAFRWLVVAQKRLAERGLDIPLVCACAEALPFADAQYDRVAAESAFEVVQDQERALAEAARVTRPGGGVWVATPNRWSLGPDPHVGIWGAGLLPEPLIARLARGQGAIPPKRRLYSARGLARGLRRAGYRRPRVFLPDVAEAQRANLPAAARALVGVYTALKRLAPARWLLLAIGPLLLAVADRATADSQP